MDQGGNAASIADASKPNAGRIYDYVLGGTHNFEVDRLAAQQILKIVPDFPEIARIIRWFLGEAVRLLAADGFTLFVDFASGLPTIDHIHKITPAGTKVIYSDIDPVTVAYGQEIIKDVPGARYVACEAGRPEALLDSPVVRDLFGTSRRVAVGFNGIAYFLPDEQITHALQSLHAWAAPGSRLFLCDFDFTDPTPEIERGMQMYARMGQPVFFRPLAKLQEMVKPWRTVRGFSSPHEWLGIPLPADPGKKSPFADVLRGAILEK
jgi:hypothetical protein